MGMRKSGILWAAGLLFFAAGCNKNSNSPSSGVVDLASADVKDMAVVSESGSMERTMEMRFRTTSVVSVVKRLEKLSKQYGGFVSRTELSFQEAELIQQPLGDDSLLELRKLIPQCHLVVYVRNEHLDSFAENCVAYADFLEYRNYTQENQELKNAFDSGYYVAAGSAKAKALRIAYSKVILSIYQPPVVKKWVIPNTAVIDDLKPGFGHDILDSLSQGWKGVVSFVLGLIALWPLWIGGTFLMLVLRKKGWLWWRKR